MRILSVNGSSSPLRCGVGYYGEALSEALQGRLEVYLLTTSGLGEKNDPPSVQFVENWKIRQLPKMLKAIRKAQPDIVHIQYPAVGYGRQLGINLLAPLLRILKPKIPVIVTLHEYYGSALLGKIRNIITVTVAHKIIVSNQPDLDRLPRFLRKKTIIIPIGHNFPVSQRKREAYESFMKSAGLSPTKPTIAYFGFINPSKGIETLVEAAAKINAQILLLAELNPKDPYQHRVLSRIDEVNTSGGAVFVAGFLDNTLLSQILQECQLFVLPQPLPLTTKSSTAIAAVEHGLVVVSTAAPKDQYNLPFIHGTNALLLDPMNEQSLTKACNALLEDPQKMKFLQANGQELISFFGWQSIAEKHEKLYTTISLK